MTGIFPAATPKPSTPTPVTVAKSASPSSSASSPGQSTASNTGTTTFKTAIGATGTAQASTPSSNTITGSAAGLVVGNQVTATSTALPGSSYTVVIPGSAPGSIAGYQQMGITSTGASVAQGSVQSTPNAAVQAASTGAPSTPQPNAVTLKLPSGNTLTGDAALNYAKNNGLSPADVAANPGIVEDLSNLENQKEGNPTYQLAIPAGPANAPIENVGLTFTPSGLTAQPKYQGYKNVYVEKGANIPGTDQWTSEAGYYTIGPSTTINAPSTGVQQISLDKILSLPSTGLAFSPTGQPKPTPYPNVPVVVSYDANGAGTITGFGTPDKVSSTYSIDYQGAPYTLSLTPDGKINASLENNTISTLTPSMAIQLAEEAAQAGQLEAETGVPAPSMGGTPVSSIAVPTQVGGYNPVTHQYGTGYSNPSTGGINYAYSTATGPSLPEGTLYNPLPEYIKYAQSLPSALAAPSVSSPSISSINQATYHILPKDNTKPFQVSMQNLGQSQNLSTTQNSPIYAENLHKIVQAPQALSIRQLLSLSPDSLLMTMSPESLSFDIDAAKQIYNNLLLPAGKGFVQAPIDLSKWVVNGPIGQNMGWAQLVQNYGGQPLTSQQKAYLQNTPYGRQYLQESTNPYDITQTALSRQIYGNPNVLGPNALSAGMYYTPQNIAAILGGTYAGATLLPELATSSALRTAILNGIKKTVFISELGNILPGLMNGGTQVVQGKPITENILPSPYSVGYAGAQGVMAGIPAGLASAAINPLLSKLFTTPLLIDASGAPIAGSTLNDYLVSGGKTFTNLGPGVLWQFLGKELPNIPTMALAGQNFGDILASLNVIQSTTAGRTPTVGEVAGSYGQGALFGGTMAAFEPFLTGLPDWAKTPGRYASSGISYPTASNLVSLLSGQGFLSLPTDVQQAIIGVALEAGGDVGPRLRLLQGQGIDVGGLTFKLGTENEMGLLNVIKTPDGWRIAPGTPSMAESFTEPQLNEKGEPVSLFPATKGFKATETPTGESSDLLTTAYGRAILTKTIADIKEVMPIDAQYAGSWLKVATLASGLRYPVPSEFKLEIDSLTPDENTFLSNLVKQYSDDILEVRGSVSTRVQMGEQFPRLPHDMDPTFATDAKAEEFVQAAKMGLNEIAGYEKYKTEEGKPTMLLKEGTGEKQGGHLIDAKSKENQEAEYGNTGTKTQLGLKQNAPVDIEGVTTQSVVQSLKDKIASALSIRLYSPEDILRAPDEWQKFLKENAGLALGKLNPLQDMLARMATGEGGYLTGSAAIKIQVPEGSFREPGDIDIAFGDQSKIRPTAEKALDLAKKYYESTGRNPDDLTLSPTGDAMHQPIFDTNELKNVVDIMYRNPEGKIPDKIDTVDGIDVRRANQIARDKSAMIRIAEKGTQEGLTPETPKVQKAAADLALMNQAEAATVKSTFAPNDWRMKDVIDPYADTKFLNQYNLNPISRVQMDQALNSAVDASKVKFGLTDEDFNVETKVDMTPLIKGNAPAVTVANTDLLFRTAAPTTTTVAATPTVMAQPSSTVSTPSTPSSFTYSNPYDPLTQAQLLQIYNAASNPSTPQLNTLINTALQNNKLNELYQNYMNKYSGSSTSTMSTDQYNALLSSMGIPIAASGLGGIGKMASGIGGSLTSAPSFSSASLYSAAAPTSMIDSSMPSYQLPSYLQGSFNPSSMPYSVLQSLYNSGYLSPSEFNAYSSPYIGVNYSSPYASEYPSPYDYGSMYNSPYAYGSPYDYPYSYGSPYSYPYSYPYNYPYSNKYPVSPFGGAPYYTKGMKQPQEGLTYARRYLPSLIAEIFSSHNPQFLKGFQRLEETSPGIGEGLAVRPLLPEMVAQRAKVRP